MNNESKNYILSQIDYMNDAIKEQKHKKSNLKISMICLVIGSCLFSSIIPIIEIFRPISMAGILSTIFAVCNTTCVAILTKFNISKKIEICNQNIITLSSNKYKLEKIYNFEGVQTNSDFNRKFSKIIDNISQLPL